MGPTIIFDKSAIQSLNPDEAMWMDNFYISNITPLFYVETLADLEKEVKEGRTAEDVVGNMAYKTPDQNSCINVHHESLLQGELAHGQRVDISGRPIAAGGKYIQLGNETGVFFQETPEGEAFKRWQKHEFLEIERSIAKKWRADIEKPDHQERTEVIHDLFAITGKLKSLSELKDRVDLIIDAPDQKSVLMLGLNVIGVAPAAREKILQRWQDEGGKLIKEFAPYFSHVFAIELFFDLGLAANLLSQFPHAQTHKIDMAYLYYLPFCNIFVSKDKLHIAVAPYFLRPDQTFIRAEDFKGDMMKIDRHYDSLPQEIKDSGVSVFAMVPPDATSFFTTQMWDKYMRGAWRDIRPRKFDGSDKFDPKREAEILKKIKDFATGARAADPSILPNSDMADHMVVKRMVMAKKGKWKRFPPQVLNSKPIFED